MKNPFVVSLLFAASFCGQLKAAVADTRIARWKDDRTAAFLLMFDDGWPSQFQVAIPELAKRGMIATFYIVPAKGEYKAFEKKWMELIPQTGMVLGDHTMTHQGVKNLENAEVEIGDCAKYIRNFPGVPKAGLVSFAQPGVDEGKWNITGPELTELLKKHHLIDRPPFKGHGAVYHWKTKEEILALADKAVANKGMECIIWHGVERIEPNWSYQDMWAMKQDILLPLFDALKEKSDKKELWITDHISQHKYETERDAAEVKVTRSVPGGIELELKCSADPEWYDGVLTLITEVPKTWKKATVIQGDAKTAIEIKDGQAMFDAKPGIVRLVAN